MAKVQELRTVLSPTYLVIGFAALLGAVFFADATKEHQVDIGLDFAYDVSDPRVVAGDASFIIVGRVLGDLGDDGRRTSFDVEVLANLKGDVGVDVVQVSQLGYKVDNLVYSAEGVEMMVPGSTYIMPLVAPGPSEPTDTLILLTGPPTTSAVLVDSPDGLKVAEYRKVIAASVAPVGDETREQRSQQAERWLNRRP